MSFFGGGGLGCLADLCGVGLLDRLGRLDLVGEFQSLVGMLEFWSFADDWCLDRPQGATGWVIRVSLEGIL